MARWFLEGVPEGTYVVPSNSGFTSDKIAIEYLKHLIKHTNAGPDAEWQLLLMDNHGSHTTPEFSLLANENRIRPFPFIPHLTHGMQPLDVGVFQPYKHWHCKAIEEVVASSFVEYSLSQFIQDLTKIRNHTFKTLRFGMHLKSRECGRLIQRCHEIKFELKPNNYRTVKRRSR